MNKLEYTLTMNRIVNAKYKKDIESIARELCSQINKHNSTWGKLAQIRTLSEYNKGIPVEEYILISKCFLRVMAKVEEKQVRLPDFITAAYTHAKDWLPIVLYQINASYEQILDTYEFESTMYLVNHHHEYIHYFVHIIDTHKPPFEIKVIKHDFHPLVDTLHRMNGWMHRYNDAIALEINYLRVHFNDQPSIVIDAIENFLYRDSRPTSRKVTATQAKQLHHELLCTVEAYERTFTSQLKD